MPKQMKQKTKEHLHVTVLQNGGPACSIRIPQFGQDRIDGIYLPFIFLLAQLPRT